MTEVCLEIVGQHAEEAAFLWTMRAAGVHAPHFLLKDLERLDDRVEAHVDGLRVNGGPAWEIAHAAAAGGGPGSVFAAAILAFQSGLEERISPVMEAGLSNHEAGRGLISALGWMTYLQAKPSIERLCASEDAGQRRLGIAAAAIHRQHPGVALGQALDAKDSSLQARAWRACGEVGAVDLLRNAELPPRTADQELRFWSAWSRALVLKDSQSLELLRAFAEEPGPLTNWALRVAVAYMGIGQAKSWCQHLSANRERLGTAIAVAGASGDPAMVSWLIEQMAVPKIARRAAEAFSLITGVHISNDKLEGERGEGSEAGPTDDPADENVSMDPDEGLAWPEPSLVAKWWSEHRKEYDDGTRYLMGKAITPESMMEVLRLGYQRQRAAAATELAILRPGQLLFEVRAPGGRQRALLSQEG